MFQMVSAIWQPFYLRLNVLNLLSSLHVVLTFLGSKHRHSKEIFQLHYIPIVINVTIIEKSSDWQWKQIPKDVFQVIKKKWPVFLCLNFSCFAVCQHSLLKQMGIHWTRKPPIPFSSYDLKQITRVCLRTGGGWMKCVVNPPEIRIIPVVSI